MRIQKTRSQKSMQSVRASHSLVTLNPAHDDDECFYDKTKFHRLLHIEKMRSERSQKPLLLMIIDISSLMNEHNPQEIQGQIKSVLGSSLRETDIKGWYNYNEKIGIIFNGVTSIDSQSIGTIIKKINDNLSKKIDSGLINKISVFFHIYPRM